MKPKRPTGRSDTLGTLENLRGRRVTVVGLGHFGGGVGVTRWLCSQGARVTVTDKAEPSTLADSLAQLDGLDLTIHLGGHDRRDFLAADLLVANPAVPKEMPLLAEAAAAGVRRTSEINLFLRRCAARIIGITGTVGKSTTAAMTAAILPRRFTTHLGGNIGGSLLESLPDISADDVVVLELSSFQLEDLPIVGISPHVAVVTNLMPNHLDRHKTMDAYAAAKKNIFAFQTSEDVLILNSACSETLRWADAAAGRVEFFDAGGEPFELAVPGRHNQANAQAAWTAARQFGIDRATAAEALQSFPGLGHRLEFVAERDGVKYFNDSKCTTPQGAITALESFGPRSAILLAGGYDKGVDFGELGAAIAARAKAAIVLGATQRQIAAAIETHRNQDAPIVQQARNLADAVEAAMRLAVRGDVVLLSPACASYDMFTNYEKRGEAFAELVR